MISRHRKAADRVCALVRDLIDQREAWAAGDPAPEVAARNPDVARYNRLRAERFADPACLPEAIAAILDEEEAAASNKAYWRNLVGLEAR